MVNTLNWVIGNDNLYCALTEYMPEHEMEKALSTTADQIKAMGILGTKIERGQIYFKIAQIKDNQAFKDKFPEALISIVSKQMEEMINEREILRTTGIPDRLSIFEKINLSDIRKLHLIIYDGQHYMVKLDSAVGFNETVVDNIFLGSQVIECFVKEFFKSRKLIEDQLANSPSII